jgi:thiosulfate dehydrogenase [quinone] large subunit
VIIERTPLAFLVPLRLACGYLLATSGLGKVLSGWLRSPLLGARLSEWLRPGHPRHLFPALIDPVLQHMQYHAQAYSIAVTATELLCGAALFVGIFSRYAALFGLLVSLLPLAGGAESAQPGANLQLVYCAALLSLSLSGAGRSLGLDSLLRGRVPPWLS